MLRKTLSTELFLRELALIEKEYKRNGGSEELYKKAIELNSVKPGFIDCNIKMDKYKKIDLSKS